MQREIFVGSSTEGTDELKRVIAILSEDNQIKCVPWQEVFQPGYLTFEALEIVLRRCCAAVFVAGPDDQTTIRGKAVNSPRANIMLEFGLMAGRLGRHNIALWQYGSAELPSDLAGLTIISVDSLDSATPPETARAQAAEKLKNWSSRLSATANELARTEIVHGYSGCWDFELTLEEWRDVKIAAPGYAIVRGTLVLIMPGDGQSGRGYAGGRLYFKVLTPDLAPYQGEYHTAHEIRNATCQQDGGLSLTTEAFAIQKITATGAAPVQLAGLESAPEPWTAKWSLVPLEGLPQLAGPVESEGVVSTRGRAKVTKASDVL